MYFKCSNVPFQCLCVLNWQGQHGHLAPFLTTASEGDLLPPERHAQLSRAHVPQRAAR